MSLFAELVREIVAILRYLAAPAVGVGVAWLFDARHDIVGIVVRSTWPWGAEPSAWPFVTIGAIGGITIYFIHRTLIHPGLQRVQLRLLNGTWPDTLLVDNLALARWHRRGAPKGTSANSIQVAIDEASAASHFFYCSAWASLASTSLFIVTAPSDFSLTSPWLFGVTVVALFALGWIGDRNTTRWDFQVYVGYQK